MSVLWKLIDDYLETAVESVMGAAGSYVDLQIVEIHVGELWDPDHWEFPAALIVGHDATHMPGPQGEGTLHQVSFYPYLVMGITEADDYDQAKDDAQELQGRVFDLLRTRFAFGGLADSRGEHITSTQITESTIRIEGPTNGGYLGIAVTQVNVYTRI